ncbi:MAG: D-erythronate dehydrogenase [Rhizobiaceae bacterium]
MHVLIVGASGMIGQKLIAKLLIANSDLNFEVTRLTLADVIKPTLSSMPSIETNCIALDIAQKSDIESLMASRPDVIFQLAAIVSAEAEADFEKGYRINLDGTRLLFDAIRDESEKESYFPRLIFSSSIAVFGAPFPQTIEDDYFSTPLTSYGTQKAICELLLSDYSRRGIFDGIGLRLPTICVRPGSPNKAASGFFSNILREPLAGKPAILPVDESVRHWFASPRAAVGFLTHAASMNLEAIGPRRNLTMPGLSATVGDQIEALRRVGGDKAIKLIDKQPDALVQKIVSGWPSNFNAQRALTLGFQADTSFDEIIRHHVEDELSGH